MIILPNGDKWIIDDRELNGLSDEDISNGKIPITSIENFINDLVKGDCLPRKLVNEEGWGNCWDCNFDPYKEVLEGFAVRSVTTEFMTAYDLVNGKVAVVYITSNGSTSSKKIKLYENSEEYMRAVSIDI